MITATTTMARGEIAPSPSAIPAPPRSAKLDFARLVGEGWERLPAGVRHRFSEKPQPGCPIRYVGIMGTVAASPLGRLLAQCCRLFGTPFAPWPGRDVATAITLSAVADEDAVIWDREYRYPAHHPILVRSIKRVGADGRLLECVGGGFGMSLDVYEADGALHFRSRCYFWRRGGRLFWLPRALTPGITHVEHIDLGDGRFRFRMTVRHKLFGILFHQDGVFRREENPS